MPSRTGKSSSCDVEPIAHIGQKPIAIAAKRRLEPFAEMQAAEDFVVGRQANDPQPPNAAERLRFADLAALVEVGPRNPAGALAGDGVGQDRDDRAEPLAVELVALLSRK